ncbi:HAD-IC family P-type ATPase [Roseitranquillus sediminis]|uniref:HAD-IC family P-type ATPase n=1 Tax=Roseitranquillus sediminis TaxID=2809051 RepID=UPI001D0C83DC|nr:HAD-IC family P-type ATPase [Roseitranquillus sediminis]MBM9593105.1 HAD-IC family P-type ATPase [Roseitranquillus sediminis]
MDANDAPAAEDWHALDVDEAMRRQESSRRGLSAEEAAARRARDGPNALPAVKPRGPMRRLLDQFDNLLIYVLLASGAITAVLGHWTDAAVIIAVVVINAAIGFWQEGRAEDALAAVRAMLSAEAAVLREGERRHVPAEDLVPGDIVLLEAGDRVPADLRLIKSSGLTTQEAALTGESAAIVKSVEAVAREAALGDRTSMAYSGTLAASGRGVGLVVATGAAAEIGRIGAMLSGIEQLKTPLLRQIDHFARLLTFLILAVCAAVFAYATMIGGYAIEEAFLAMVGLAVAAIPEGLPAVLTITLALGVQRMAARNAIIRRLPAVETLGAVSVICTDKTGTLTLNEMVVRRVVVDPREAPLDVTGEGYDPAGALSRSDLRAEALARTGLLCGDAQLLRGEDGWRVEGDPMEGALVAFACKAGLNEGDEHARHTRIAEIPFDADHRFMATLNKGPDGRKLHVKGAPDRLLELSARQESGELDRAAWQEAIETLAADGHRVLAFAQRPLDADALTMDDVRDLTLIGLAGFIDPARPEAIEAVAACRSAGIDVKMITGDHARTALAVAAELGLDTSGGAMIGADVASLDDAELSRHAGRVGVFARAAPEHKLRLVEALQAKAQVVAMTGDGVNDAPALKRADVGIAMGIKGTEAAKEAARMVLADDNFASIVAAVREGRTIYDNIRKVIAWTLPTNGGESLVIIAAILLGITLPVTPVQILWINMVTAVTLGLTLSFEPAEPGVMERRPRRMEAGLLDAEMIWRVALVSVLFGLAVFGLFFWSLERGDELELARTLVVNLIVAMEIAYLFSVRYLHLSGFSWTGLMGTRAVLLGVAAAILLQAGFTYAPPMQVVFDTQPMSLADLALIGGASLVLLLGLEAEKWLRRAAGILRPY